MQGLSNVYWAFSMFKHIANGVEAQLAAALESSAPLMSNQASFSAHLYPSPCTSHGILYPHVEVGQQSESCRHNSSHGHASSNSISTAEGSWGLVPLPCLTT